MKTIYSSQSAKEKTLEQILQLVKQGKNDEEIWRNFPDATAELGDVLEVVRQLKEETSTLNPSMEFARRVVDSLTIVPVTPSSVTRFTAIEKDLFTQPMQLFTKWFIPVGVTALILMIGAIIFINQQPTEVIRFPNQPVDLSVALSNNISQELASLESGTDWGEDTESEATLSELNTTFALLTSEEIQPSLIPSSPPATNEIIDFTAVEAERQQLEEESVTKYFSEPELQNLDGILALI